MQHWFSPFRAEVHTPDYKCFINTCQLHLIHSDLMQYCILYTCVATLGQPLQVQSADDTSVCWGMLWKSVLITHVSAAFQAAFTLVTDLGPFRSMGTWNKKVVRSILPLWRFYTFSVYASCLPFLNRLVWFDFALLLRKKKPKKKKNIWLSEAN